MKFNKNQIVFSRWHDCLTRVASRIIAIFILGAMFSCTIADPDDGLKFSTSFKSSSISTNAVTLSWEWNTDYNVTNYILSNQTTGENLANLTNLTIEEDPKKSESYTVTNLNPNTEYTFHLKACGNWGCSADSSLKVTTRPAPPENFNFVKEKNTSTSLSFTWDAPPLGGAAHYMLYQGNDVVAEKITSTEQSVSNLEPGTEYTFGLVACNKNDLCSTTNEQTFTTPPAMVTDLAIKGDPGITTVTLSWTEPRKTTSYVVSKQKYGGAIEVVTSNLMITDDTPEFTIYDLTPRTNYIFSLQACNKYGCSSGATANVTTKGATHIPGSLSESFKIVGVFPTSVSLDWSAPDGATHYRIFYTNVDNGGPEVSNQVNTSEFVITGLKAATKYRFEVQACNDLGCSAKAYKTFSTTPNAPENFTNGTVTSTTVYLEWNVVAGATRYQVGYKDSSGYRTSGYLSSEKTDYTVTTDLEPNTEYTFWVSACGKDFCSPRKTLNLTTAPNVPKNFTTDTVSSTIVTLTWNKVTEADNYVIYTNSSDSSPVPSAIATNSGNTFTVTNLHYGKEYTFKLQACNSNGCSDFSDLQVTTTTPSQDFFTIHYPTRMNYDTSVTSIPTIVSGKDCDLKALTALGNATYKVYRNTTNTGTGAQSASIPEIDPKTGVVNNKGGSGTSPGVYKVEVIVPGTPTCTTNVLVYNTYTPGDDKSVLVSAINEGINFYGNRGNFNYIDTSQITDMSSLFADKTSFNGDISEWKTEKVIDMSHMFNGATSFNQDISDWNTSKVTKMDWMFQNARSFNQDIGNWNTSNVTRMYSTFQGATTFNKPLNNWGTSKVETMESMFKQASAFNQDISGWDTSKVTQMNYMFNDATNFNQPIGEWETSNVTTMHSMFNNAQKFDQNLSRWKVDKVTSYINIFTGSAMETLTDKHPKWKQ